MGWFGTVRLVIATFGEVLDWLVDQQVPGAIIAAALLALVGTLWRRRSRPADGGPTEAERRRVREGVWKDWVGPVLEPIEEGTGWLDVALDTRPDLVVRTLGAPDVGTATDLDDLLRRAVAQLLVVGQPGAGKTVLLMDLVRRLQAGVAGLDLGCEPVVFPLSSWTGAPFGDWLAEYLHRRYGLPPRRSVAWVNGGHVLPVLDGLDEVAPARRADCLAAIAAWTRDDREAPRLMACRTEEYGVLVSPAGGVDDDPRPRFHHAVEVSPLSRERVLVLLSERDPSAGWEDLSQWSTVAGAAVLDVLATPLYMQLSALASPAELLAAAEGGPTAPGVGRFDGSHGAVRAELLGRLVDRVAAAPSQFGTPSDRRRWLASIGELTTTSSESRVLYLDGFWTAAPRSARVVSVLAVVVAAVAFAAMWLRAYDASGWYIGLAVVMGLTLLSAALLPIDPRPRIFVFELRSLARTLSLSRLGVFIAVFTLSAVGVPLVAVLLGRLAWDRYFVAAPLAVAACTLAVLLRGTSSQPRDHVLGRDVVARCASRVAVHAAVMGVTGAVGALLASYALVGVYCVAFSVPVMMSDGLGFLFGYHAARRRLHRRGHLPLDLVPFLEWAADRRVLRRVGAGWSFFHKELQDFLALEFRRATAPPEHVPAPTVPST